MEASLKEPPAGMEEKDEERRRVWGFLETSVEELSGKGKQSAAAATEELRLEETEC